MKSHFIILGAALLFAALDLWMDIGMTALLLSLILTDRGLTLHSLARDRDRCRAARQLALALG